jgi:hypothetical protein
MDYQKRYITKGMSGKSMACRVFGCGADANQMHKISPIGWFHCECEKGHKFHIGQNPAEAELCGCQFKADPGVKS